MDEDGLYFVRTPEIIESRLPEIVEQLRERGVEVLNAYFIFVGVPDAPDSHPADGVEFVLKTDARHTEIEAKLEGIIPENSQLYTGIDLLTRVPV